MELTRVTLKYKDIDDLITQLSELRNNPAIGLYTDIELIKDYHFIYEKETEEK